MFPTTILIIIVTSLVSYQAFNKPELKNKLIFNPPLVLERKQYYRLLSHGLIHADWAHLIFNMVTLYFFGKQVSYNLDVYFNSPVFMYLILYISGILIASLPALIKHKNNEWYYALGASGGVSAILFTAIFFDPWIGIMFIFFPIPIPGFIFGIIYLVASHYLSKKSNDNIAHDAHIAGAIYGFLFPVLLKPRLFIMFIEKLFS